MSDVDRISPSADAHPIDTSTRPVVVPARSAAARPARPWRWLVALLTTAFMFAGTLGVATFAQTGQFGSSDGPTFLPADAVIYAEARLDLPGDQRDQLIAFLGSFPGFADPASFDTKLDQTIDELLGGEDSPISWTGDIKPWFGGQIMFGLPALPDLTGTMDAEDAASVGISALGVTDRAALDAALVKLLATMDDVTTEEYAGTTISIVDADDDMPTALAPTDELLLFSNDPQLVRDALDLLAGSEPSLADDADFQAAIAALPADRLGAFVIDTQQLRDELGPLLEEQLAEQPEMAAVAPQIEAALAMLPPSVTGHIRVDADHLTARIDSLHGESTPIPAVRSTDLASKMPADTIVYLETRDVGAGIRMLVEQLKPLLEEQGNEAGLAQIEALLGTGLENYLEWVEDLAVGGSLGIAGPSVGLAATVTDEAVGQQRVNSLLTLVRAISATADPSPVEISQEEIAGVTVTTITLTESSGMTGDLPVVPEISIAVGDGHLYLGLGDFAAQALTRDAADSLASAAGFTRAVEATGGDNAGIVFVDVASAVSFAELMMSDDDREMFNAQIQPYVGALDFVVAALDADDTSSSASLMLFVK